MQREEVRRGSSVCRGCKSLVRMSAEIYAVPGSFTKTGEEEQMG